MPTEPKTVKIGWMLFKASGKWAYGGKSEVPATAHIWDDTFVGLVDNGQGEVAAGTIARRSYTLVTYDLPENDADPNYRYFFTAMFPPRPQPA